MVADGQMNRQIDIGPSKNTGSPLWARYGENINTHKIETITNKSYKTKAFFQNLIWKNGNRKDKSQMMYCDNS